ncbi:MAG: hypothetical protein AB8F34_15255 [Akkermansiaceae bacterium]
MLSVKTRISKVFLGGIKDPEESSWRFADWNVRVSPNQNAAIAAMMYGSEPLISGVVGHADWRRKPDKLVNLAESFKAAGYTTLYGGHWLMGAASPYRPMDRGYDTAILRTKSMHAWINARLVDSWEKKQRVTQYRSNVKNSISCLEKAATPFLLFALNESPEESVDILKEIKVLAEHAWKTSRRETYCIVVSQNGVQDGWAMPIKNFHYAGAASLWHLGQEKNFKDSREHFLTQRTDGELGKAIVALLNSGKIPPLTFRVFHKANWPVGESPDKHRHRGSLVVGKGHALVDGLELYPATKEMLPDLTKPLDISKHQKLHAEMLTAHAKWWLKARPALHNPRSFDVGQKDKIPARLTAMDWRPSKTIHADNTSPSSQPVVYQKVVLDLLKGLQNEKFRQDYPAHTGSWSVNILRPGRYQITASLLPTEIDAERKKLARLRGGRAFIRLGKNLVQLQLTKGATTVTVKTDADAGVTDLECWFTGQLALERELGAFFVEIQRVGDKKFDFEAKP